MRFLPLIALAACDTARLTPSVPMLPDLLSAVVRLERGGYASVLAELGRPGQWPTVRLLPAIVAVGGGRALEVDVSDGSPVRVGIADLAFPWEGARAHAEGPAPVRVVRIDHDAVFVAFGDENGPGNSSDPTVRVDAPPPTGSASGAVFHATHAGPAGAPDAFEVRVEEGLLELRLPRSEWLPVLQGVEDLVWARWLHSAELPEPVREVLASRFKQVGVLSAPLGRAAVDGDLAEWEGERAFAVQSADQVIERADGWQGRLDGSFGVAARVWRHSIFLALRVRDDEPTADDRLEVQLGTDSDPIVVPLAPDAFQLGGDGWIAAARERMGRDRAVEMWLFPGELRPDRLALPLVVHFIDADTRGPATRLGTAPWPSLVGAGYVRPIPSMPPRVVY